MIKILLLVTIFCLLNINVNGQYNRIWQQPYLTSPHKNLYSEGSLLDSNDQLHVLFVRANANSGNALLKYDVFGQMNCVATINLPNFATAPLGGFFKDNADNFYCGYVYGLPHLLKYDSDCNFIWDKKDSIYDGLNGYTNGGIGMDDADNFISVKVYLPVSTYHNSYSIHKFDPAFNFKWTYIVPDTIVFGNNQHLFGVFTFHQNIYLQYVYDRFDISLGFIDDNYLVKIDSLGNKIWSTYYNTGWLPSSIIADDSDNIYFSSRSGLTDSLAVLKTGKIDSSGAVLWTSDFTNNPIEDIANAKVTLDNANNLYVLGNSYSISGTSYKSKIVLLKYDGMNGNLIWKKLIEGTDTSGVIGFNSPADIKIDHLQNILICGSIVDTVNVDSVKRTDAFLMQLDTAGNIIWSDTSHLGFARTTVWNEIQLKQNDEAFYAVGSYVDTSAAGLSFLNLAYYCKNPCTTGINKELQDLISIYPNPASSSCTIIANSFPKATLSLYDVTGRKLTDQVFNERGELRLENFASDIYFLLISDVKGRKIKTKLIKY